MRALGAKRHGAGVAAKESRRQRGGRSMVSLTLGVFFLGPHGVFLRLRYGCGGFAGAGWEACRTADAVLVMADGLSRRVKRLAVLFRSLTRRRVSRRGWAGLDGMIYLMAGWCIENAMNVEGVLNFV